ncbi:hypothetical protein [Stenotrophomonas sp. MMGLT7]|nr:hypothetical protein [Stenotrophomonas sp. MMGLT7]
MKALAGWRGKRLGAAAQAAAIAPWRAVLLALRVVEVVWFMSFETFLHP